VRPAPGGEQAAIIAHLQYPIDGRGADLEGLRDLQSVKPCAFISRTWARLSRPASLEHASGLGLGDALKLALAPQVGFELGEHAQQVQEALAGRRAGVDRLFGGLQ
jgi:hypothetical protein